jgi:hypothetical protein
LLVVTLSAAGLYTNATAFVNFSASNAFILYSA